MSLTRIIGSSVFMLLAGFSPPAQKPYVKNWIFNDYFKNLPEKYTTFYGDFLAPFNEMTVIDEQNSCAVYLDSTPPGRSNSLQFLIFEMALFKSETKPPLVVAANLKSDSVCYGYETFFLRRVRNDWRDAKSQVLPPLNLKMFWNALQFVERLLKIIEANRISYQFEPPRRGAQMKVSPEICDYLEDDVLEDTAKKLSVLNESAKTIRLDWDAKNGRIKFAE